MTRRHSFPPSALGCAKTKYRVRIWSYHPPPPIFGLIYYVLIQRWNWTWILSVFKIFSILKISLPFNLSLADFDQWICGHSPTHGRKLTFSICPQIIPREYIMFMASWHRLFNGPLGGPLSKALPGMKGQGVEPPPHPQIFGITFPSHFWQCKLFSNRKFFLVILLSNPHSLKTVELPLRSTML